MDADQGIAERAAANSGQDLLKRLRAPALALIIIFLVLTVIFWRLGSQTIFEPPYLYFGLDLLLPGLPTVIIAVVATGVFLRTGIWPLLWLGAAALTFGVANTLSSFLLAAYSVNDAVSAQNVCVLLAAWLFLAGAF